MILNYLNLTAIIIYGLLYPMKRIIKNHIEFQNETFVQFATLHFICFTDFVRDYETQYMVGWSLIIVIGINMCINFSYIIKRAINDLKLVAILWYNYIARFSSNHLNPILEKFK